MKILILILFLIYPIAAIAESELSISYLCMVSDKQHGNGIKVLRDGHIFRLLKHEHDEKAVEIAAGENSDRATSLFNLVETNGFLESVYDRGKCSITYSSPNKTHAVKFSGKAPKPIRDIFSELQTLHRNIVEQKGKASPK